jgi:GntR family transcriptional regulator, transcriptional repressor for pyruvate dehydrogenase complex
MQDELTRLGRRPARRQLRQPRLAELVAETLRSRITGGELREGDMLPKQSELLEEFQVSKPSLREALRILETEGLITVLRGNTGGALIHEPGHRDAGYTIGLVLKSRGVPIADLGTALKQLEPLCATLCAEREDRETAVLPRLRDLHARVIDALDDELAFEQLSRQFHEQLVAACGNETLILLAGALESLWSVREQDWARRATAERSFPAREMRLEGIKAHQRLIELIEKGDTAAVNRVARRHLDSIQTYAVEPD